MSPNLTSKVGTPCKGSYPKLALSDLSNVMNCLRNFLLRVATLSKTALPKARTILKK